MFEVTQGKVLSNRAERVGNSHPGERLDSDMNMVCGLGTGTGLGAGARAGVVSRPRAVAGMGSGADSGIGMTVDSDMDVVMIFKAWGGRIFNFRGVFWREDLLLNLWSSGVVALSVSFDRRTCTSRNPSGRRSTPL